MKQKNSKNIFLDTSIVWDIGQNFATFYKRGNENRLPVFLFARGEGRGVRLALSKGAV